MPRSAWERAARHPCYNLLLSFKLAKEELRQRVLETWSQLGSSDRERQQAAKNWYVVYGDDLVADTETQPA